MQQLMRPTFVHIHLDKLMTNFRRLQTLNPGQPFLCPMLKANAYGHGDVAVAKALVQESCSHLGVASVEEAKQLRDHHISVQILTFGFHGREAVKEIINESLTPVVSNFNQLELLVELVPQHMDIHLKFNTGMNRLGFVTKDIPRVLDMLMRNSLLHIEGICTHLHSGQDVCIEGSSAAQQIKDFAEISRKISSPVKFQHVYNSAALMAIYKNRASFPFGARPGLLVYGIDPGENLSMRPLVSPVMEFKSKIVSTHRVKSGEVVSYGGTWQAKKNSLIGIVPAGYGDGVCRSLSDCGEVLVRQKRVPIRGRVCMDYTMIDLTRWASAPDSLINEDVVFIGRQGDEEITVTDVVKASGRISYEILTGIGQRVPRIYGVIG